MENPCRHLVFTSTPMTRSARDEHSLLGDAFRGALTPSRAGGAAAAGARPARVALITETAASGPWRAPSRWARGAPRAARGGRGSGAPPAVSSKAFISPAPRTSPTPGSAASSARSRSRARHAPGGAGRSRRRAPRAQQQRSPARPRKVEPWSPGAKTRRTPARRSARRPGPAPRPFAVVNRSGTTDDCSKCHRLPVRPRPRTAPRRRSARRRPRRRPRAPPRAPCRPPATPLSPCTGSRISAAVRSSTAARTAAAVASQAARHERRERRLLGLLRRRAPARRYARGTRGAARRRRRPAWPCALERRLDGLNAEVGEDLRPVAGSARETLRERHHPRGVEEVADVDQPGGLLLDRGDDRGVAVADVRDAEAHEESRVLVAVGVPRPSPDPGRTPRETAVVRGEVVVGDRHDATPGSSSRRPRR